jgi:UDP-N-acetylmuramoylalanine--D-glutamate ligase
VNDPSALDSDLLDLVVRSPGVSRYRQELERLRASGVEVTTPTAIWLEDFAMRRVIGVTGSKGKTMTASLTALALEANGMTVGLGGNIGTPLTDFYEGPEKDAYVIEVSSFQAAEVTASPPVGILTLLSPDHLDWHGSYDRYVADKLNLFAHRGDLELAINARCPDAVGAARSVTTTDRRHLYGPEGRVQVAGEGISIDGEAVPALRSVASKALRGRHNLDNLCGAITACRLLTGEWPDFVSFAAAVASMPALPSRLETVAVSGSVEFVDDTLASNPAGTIAALEAFSGRRLSLICGGHDRHTDLRGLARALDAFGDVGGAGGVRGSGGGVRGSGGGVRGSGGGDGADGVDSLDGVTVIFLGDAGERLSSELAAISSDVSRSRARTVSEAVGLALRALEHRAGDKGETSGVVLFSPAAPTPPCEGTYVERSAEFRRAVTQYLHVQGDGDSAAC